MSAPECLEALGECSGPVEWHRLPGAERSFPRCAFHWERRLAEWENSLEREALSPTPPAWFDPMAAGERWDEDDAWP